MITIEEFNVDSKVECDQLNLAPAGIGPEIRSQELVGLTTLVWMNLIMLFVV